MVEVQREEVVEVERGRCWGKVGGGCAHLHVASTCTVCVSGGNSHCEEWVFVMWYHHTCK